MEKDMSEVKNEPSRKKKRTIGEKYTSDLMWGPDELLKLIDINL